MAFWVTIGIYAGLFILSKLLAKDTGATLGGQPNDAIAKPPEGAPLTLWWGRVNFTEPALVWNTERTSFNRRGWAMDMQFILGIPMEGTGAGGSTRIVFESFRVNGAKMKPTYEDRFAAINYHFDGVTQLVTDPDVTQDFWYEDDFNDETTSVAGRLILEAGTPSVGSNSFMGVRIANLYQDISINRWPRYEGQTKVTLIGTLHVESEFLDPEYGFIYGPASDPTASLPTLEFELMCKVTHDFGGGRPLVKSLPNGDANPAGVIYDVLTSKWGKLGLDVSNIDLDSFAAAGETLYEEDHGFSYILNATVDAKDFILDVLKQINAVLYEDPTTRKLVLSLTRADYVIGDLPEFDPSNVIAIQSFSTSTFDETYNEVRVIYTNRQQRYKDSTAIAQDMANLTSQGGKIRSVTRQYRGATTERLAAMLAARDLREMSVPLAQVQMRVNRDAWVLRPNACFKLSWAEFAGMTDSVFRVAKIDSGTLEDSALVITAIQDIFSVTEGLMTPPEIMPIAVAPPRAIERRIFTEAPRWFLRKAVARGINSDIDIPRGYYLGARPEEASSGFMSRITDALHDDDRTFLRTDRDQINYPRIHGVVETAYSRTADPYDTSTGLRITLDSFSALPNFTATADEIGKGKRNIVYVGGEIIAYETLTFISGFTWRLDDVWRGLLDTVPVDHAVGEPVFILSFNNEFVGDFHTGNRHDVRDYSTLAAVMRPITNGVWMPMEDDALEYDVLVNPKGRTLLPYPSANVTIEGTKGTQRREEEGFALAWKRRGMNYTTIVRGDDSSQIVTTTQFLAIAKKIGPRGLLGSEQIIGIATEADEALEVAAAAAGYGTLAVFPRTVDLSTNLTNWQDPELPVEFPCWRNLVANCRLADVFSSNVTQPWTIVSGDLIRVSNSISLGGDSTSWYATGDGTSGSIEFYQDVALAEWPLTNMGALLSFYHRRTNGDADDSLQVDIEAYNASGSLLDSDTHGPTTSPTTWTRTELVIASLDPATVKLRIRVRMTYIDEPPTNPDTAITEFGLYVGQIGRGFLSNVDFTTDLASWTVPTGTFTRQTTDPYTGVGYARGGTGTTNEMYQDVSFPAEFNYGTCVVEYAQGDEGGTDNDLGYVQIDARNGGGTVIASANSPAIKAVTVVSTWARRRVVLENIPPETATLRVRVIATRTAGGTADATFDDFQLKLFKELDPDYRLDLSVTTPPSTRYPKNGSAWYDAYPAVPPPDFMLYDGERLEGQVGIESNLGTPTTPYLGKLHGPYDADHDTWSTSAYDFRPGCQALEAIDDGAGYFANFASGEPFTVVAVVRPGHGNSTTRRICGRIDGTTGGWCLEFLSTGRFQARIRSGGSTWTASPTTVTVPGNVYCVQMAYDPAAGQLRCSVNDDAGVTTAVTVGTSIHASNDLLFRIGKAEAADTLWNGQVVRLYGWRTAYAHFMNTMATYGDRPMGIAQTMTCSQTGQVMAPLGDDIDGITMAVYHAGAIPLGRQQGNWGYVLCDQVENNCNSRDLTDAAAYPPTSGSATITRTGIVGPTGEGNGVRVVATVLDGLRVASVPVNSSTTVHVYFFARTLDTTPGDGTISIRLENTSGTSLGTATKTLGTSWALIDHVFTTWDDSTANMQLEIVATIGGPGEFDIAGPIIINQDAQVQYALPYNDLITQHHIEASLSGITQQFNHEGEIYVEGTKTSSTAGPSPDGLVIDVTNGANNNDRRLYTIADASGSFSHYNASGTVATGTSGAPTWTGSTSWSGRARWTRTGLLDSLTSWARSITNGTASSARAATFTASSTPMTDLDMTGGVSGVVRRVIVFAREVILGQDV